MPLVLLRVFSNGVPALARFFSIFPTVAGGVLFEFELNGWDYSVEFEIDGAMEFFGIQIDGPDEIAPMHFAGPDERFFAEFGTRVETQ